MSNGTDTIDLHELGVEKAILRLILKICKLRGDWTTALAFEEIAGEIRVKMAKSGDGKWIC
ncbi:hypothetical protein ACKFKH_32445 [Phormidesmis sp. 146-20]